eukprot:706008-Prymnesium_polylepis.1
MLVDERPLRVLAAPPVAERVELLLGALRTGGDGAGSGGAGSGGRAAGCGRSVAVVRAGWRWCGRAAWPRVGSDGGAGAQRADDRARTGEKAARDALRPRTSLSITVYGESMCS